MQNVNLHIEYCGYQSGGRCVTWFRGISDNPPHSKGNSYGETTDDWYATERDVVKWALDTTINWFILQPNDKINIDTAGGYTSTGVDWSPYSQYTIIYNGVQVSPPSCVPNWQCEQPSNGYESDGCGNRRANSACCSTPSTSFVLS